MGRIGRVAGSEGRREQADGLTPGARHRPSWRDRVASIRLVFPVFALIALLIYSPALRGPFVSDDLHYVAGNPYVREPSLANVLDVLHPYGAAARAVDNWAPVHLLLHTASWKIFGEAPLGHHVVNVLFHALASALLTALLLRCGLKPLVSVLGGAFFLLHPANVEAVAWISQLKSPAALVLALGALLLHERHPALSVLAFGLALLAKPTAAFALPLAALLDACRLAHGGDSARQARRSFAWLGLWALLLVGFAYPELSAFHQSNATVPSMSFDPWTQARTTMAIVARYFVMASTSYGVSAFQEPPPARSFLDPWWLLSVPLVALLGWRVLRGLVKPRAESAFWVSAAAAFAPVSQVFPFLYPMADRYLYFMLPGLVGGVLLAGDAALASASPGVRQPRLRRALLLGVIVLLVFFGARSVDRARVWSSSARLLADASLHYPDGASASLARARSAAQAGDTEAAVRALRAAYVRGFNQFVQIEADPALSPLRDAPAFRAVVRDMASTWVAWGSSLRHPSQLELHMLAKAHLVLGDRDEAISLLERALSADGPVDDEIRRELAVLRRGRGPASEPGGGGRVPSRIAP